MKSNYAESNVVGSSVTYDHKNIYVPNSYIINKTFILIFFEILAMLLLNDCSDRTNRVSVRIAPQ